MGKLVTALALVAFIMLTTAFLAPHNADGKLFSGENFAHVFSLDGVKDRFARMTPGYVFTVSANTASNAANSVLGAASKTLSPVANISRDPTGTAKEAVESAAETFIPQTKEEKRIELIDALEERVAELELESAGKDETVSSLTAEIDKLVKELKAVREDGGLIDAAIEGTKKTLAPGEECECNSR